MDREDAAFAVDVLERRISGDRGELDAVAASSLMRLSAIAAHIRHKANAWPPALAAAAELMAIARLGGAVLEHAIAPEIEPFLEAMRKLVDEAPKANRQLRRERASRLRSARREIVGIAKPPIVLIK